MRALLLWAAIAALAGPAAGLPTGDPQTLQAAGSSLTARFYSDAARLSPVELTYEALSSSRGVCRLLGHDAECEADDEADPHTVDFAATDRLLTDAESAAFPDAQLYPAVATGIVPVVNLPELGEAQELTLSMDLLARIYLGDVAFWNDSAIVDAQFDESVAALLPETRIVPVARASGSGTSAIWTAALSSASSDFAAAIGNSSDPDFGGVVETFATRASGMAGAVLTTPHAIGYLNMGHAAAVKLRVPCLAQPSSSSSAAAAAVVEPSFNSIVLAVLEQGGAYLGNTDLHSASGDGAWPIVGLSYHALLLEGDADADCDRRHALMDYLTWFHTSQELRDVAQANSLVMPGHYSSATVLEHLYANLKCGDDLVASHHEHFPQLSVTVASTLQTLFDAAHVLIASKDLLPGADLVATLDAENSETVLSQWDGSGVVVLPQTLDALDPALDAVRVPFLEVEHAAVYSLCNTVADEECSHSTEQVQLSKAVLVDILTGVVTRWDDAALVALNPWLADVDLAVSVHWGRNESECVWRPMEALGGDVEDIVGTHHRTHTAAMTTIGATPGGLGVFPRSEGAFDAMLREVALTDGAPSTVYDVVTRKSITGGCGEGGYADELLNYLGVLMMDEGGSDVNHVITSANMSPMPADEILRQLQSISCDGVLVAVVIVPENVVSHELRVAGTVLASVGLLFAVACIVFAVKFRAARIVRYAQPEFLVVVCLGSIVSLLSTFFMGWDMHTSGRSQEELDDACMAQVWLYCIGFGMTYSALIAKTTRVLTLHRRASRTPQRYASVSARQAMKYVALVVGVQVAVLSCWQARDPLVYTRAVTLHGARSSETCGKCDSATSWTYLGPLALLQAATYLYGNVVSYQTRHVDTQFSESKYIAACMFQGLQVAMLGVPVAFMTADDPPALYVVLVAAVLLQAIGVPALLVGPKMFAIATGSSPIGRDYEKAPPFSVALSSANARVRVAPGEVPESAQRSPISLRRSTIESDSALEAAPHRTGLQSPRAAFKPLLHCAPKPYQGQGASSSSSSPSKAP